MKRLVVAAVWALGLIASPMAQAAPAENSAQVTEAEMAVVDKFVRGVSVWAGGYNGLVEQQAAVLTRLIDGAQTAIGYNESGKTREGRAWAKTWAAERRAEVLALKSNLAGLSRRPPSAFVDGIDLARDARVARMMKAMERLPDLTARQIASGEALSLTTIGAAERAAGGDEAAVVELGLAMLDLSVAVVEAESQQTQALLDMGIGSNSPQEMVMKSTVALNGAYADIFRLIKADALEEATDRPAVARRVRESARTIARASEDMKGRIVDNRRMFASMGLPGDPVIKRYEAAIDTFSETSATLAGLAALVERMASSIDSGASLDADALGALMDEAEPHLTALGQQDQRRRALVAGS